MSAARVLHGEAVATMRRELADGSIDMIYSDPPFGTQREWVGVAGRFSDRWRWDAAAERGAAEIADFMPMVEAIQPRPDMRAYLVFVARLLRECRRVLRPTGTLWLHFDDTMGAYIRLVGDIVFGGENAVGALVWKRTNAHNHGKGFGRVHDTIAVWSRTPAARFRLHRCGAGGFDPCDPDGPTFLSDIIDQDRVQRLNQRSKERTGYPTEKPPALIAEFVRAATLPGGTVLDPTCGSGAALVAAHRLGRRAFGIDRNIDAVALARRRLTGPPAGPRPAPAALDFGLFAPAPA